MNDPVDEPRSTCVEGHEAATQPVAAYGDLRAARDGRARAAQRPREAAQTRVVSEWV